MTDLRPGRFYTTRAAHPTSTRSHYVIFEPELEHMMFDMPDEPLTPGEEGFLIGTGGTVSRSEAIADLAARRAASNHRAYPDDSFTAQDRIAFWNEYLDNRTGTYEFRCRRYDAVIDRLRKMGMRPSHAIVDIGAGRMEFAQRLREQGHLGFYIPIDGAIDGTDLNTWVPSDYVDWVTAIEVVEHMRDPYHLMARMKVMARYGMVITTPNPAVVDVIAMDPTHLVPVSIADLAREGYDWESASLFTDHPDGDTLIGWYDRRRPEVTGS